MEHRKLRRAGEAAAALAERRRAGAAAAAAARANLAAYWNRHNAGAPNAPNSQAAEDHINRIAQHRAENLVHQRHKEKLLEERRNKLSLMLFHEDLQIQEELKNVAMRAKYMKNTTYMDSVPIDVLRDINLGIRAREEEQQKQEAEIRLYHQWRNNNPVIQKYEKSQRNVALKSAWMEQVIEKEMTAKRENEELQKILRERDFSIKQQIEREKEDELVKEHKMKEIQQHLIQQINELRESENIASTLMARQESEQNLLRLIEEATKTRAIESSKRVAAHEAVLSNMSLYAWKIRERAREAERDVIADQRELDNVITAIENDAYKEDLSKKIWREALMNAKDSFQRQRELEKTRQQRLNDAMDGEARIIFQKQNETWQEEHRARQALLNDVLSTLKKQIHFKVLECQEKHKKNILDREVLLEGIEKAAREMEVWEAEKEKQRQGLSKISILQNQMKQIEREEKELTEENEQEDKLKRAILEEERLRNEIIKLQREGSGFQMHRRRRVDW